MGAQRLSIPPLQRTIWVGGCQTSWAIIVAWSVSVRLTHNVRALVLVQSNRAVYKGWSSIDT